MREINEQRRASGQACARQKSHGIGIPAHEIAEQLGGVLAVAFAENAIAEAATHGGIQHTFLLKAGEGIGIENLGPLVAVVASGISDGAAEKMAKTTGYRGCLGLQWCEVTLK